jgi:hypothetical protein
LYGIGKERKGLGLYRGKRWEGRIREGRKEERDDLASNKIPGSATDSQCAAGSASTFDKCCQLHECIYLRKED